MRNVENLYHLWNHVEDTVFRLGAANWRTHRTLVADENYSPLVRKGLTSFAALGRYFDSRRDSLNFSNYLAARGFCHCGAFAFADWERCTCDLPKSTVEFRVFNGTANLRKIHAYTALSLALVETAKHEPFKINRESFPEHEWTRTEALRDTSDASKRALSLIFERLPLTDSERDDLRYCAENSSLSEVIASL